MDTSQLYEEISFFLTVIQLIAPASVLCIEKDFVCNLKSV